MDSNLTAHYLAIQAERMRLPAQAELGWLAEQAATARPRRSMSISVRRWAGATLIDAGARMQGTTGPVLDAMRTDQHPAAVQDA